MHPAAISHIMYESAGADIPAPAAPSVFSTLLDIKPHIKRKALVLSRTKEV